MRSVQQQIESKPRTDEERAELERFVTAYAKVVGGVEVVDAIQRRRTYKYEGEERSWELTAQHAMENVAASRKRAARRDRNHV